MTKLIHHSPLGALEIPGVLGFPEPGEPFDAPADIAATLLEQSELYEEAPADSLRVARLREIAEARGIDITGLKKKADIEAAIAAADAEEAQQ